ncbi:hypothetical protein [Pseudarthrobacter sp. S9]|uniref:hypothetical protein n=1 Tax=Pseudarthrobacter sp. S9 TaxID=3418421 RepID=UPI003D041882
MSRALALLLVPVLVPVLAVGACSGPPAASASAAERTVGVGYETVVDAAATLPDLASRLDEVKANSVTISVGRLDWTAFPWDSHPDVEAAPGRDHVADAIKALGTDGSGKPRRITLTIDLLVPAWIRAAPGIAGINFDGTRSKDFASVTALTTGPVGERLVEFVTDLTRRYHPDAVALTELMFENNTYGGDDRDSYRRTTGAADWPRLANGDIDVAHPTIGSWRSQALASLVARASAAAHANGATLDMDVRAPWADPAGDRPESGHDYGLLAAAADRLVVWNYFGLNNAPASYSAELAEAMAGRRGKFVMSVGMWATEGRISAADLAAGLEASVAGGATAVAVTPASMLDGDAWRALRKAWAG